MRIERPAIGFLPAVPVGFGETNVRTYVVGPGDRDGLWFFDLEVASLPLAIGARSLLRVPYRWSSMTVRSSGPTTIYEGRRREHPPASHRIAVRRGDPIVERADTLAHWLAGRWRAWTHAYGRLVAVPVEHPPWPLFDAALEEIDGTLLSAAGVGQLGPPDLVHSSPGVDARLGWPRVR